MASLYYGRAIASSQMNMSSSIAREEPNIHYDDENFKDEIESRTGTEILAW